MRAPCSAARSARSVEPAIVAVEDGGAARLQAFEDLGLRLGDRRLVGEMLEVHRLDRRHDGYMRADELRQRADLAGWFMPISKTPKAASAGMRASVSGTPQ